VEWLAEHLQEAEFWVGLALAVFALILVWVKIPAMAGKALDARAEKIRGELFEAERLRKEAEALLASIKSQREEAERQSTEMIRNAEEEAKRLEADARVRLEDQIKRRAELAQRKIATAEAQAAADVKAAAADLAAETASALLAARLASVKSDPLVDRAIKDIPVKLS
jgi:F-type H+-transporting ATPase subunit b